VVVMSVTHDSGIKCPTVLILYLNAVLLDHKLFSLAQLLGKEIFGC
jgi:hypothetical protein